MTEFAVQTLHLTKRLGDFVALNSVDMHVPTGSVYGLVGPNGAGKSTLLQHIAGIYRLAASTFPRAPRSKAWFLYMSQ